MTQNDVILEIDRVLRSLLRQARNASRYENYRDQLHCFEVVSAQVSIQMHRTELRIAPLAEQPPIRRKIRRIELELSENFGASWMNSRPPFQKGVSLRALRTESRVLENRIKLTRERIRKIGKVNFCAGEVYQELEKRKKKIIFGDLSSF